MWSFEIIWDLEPVFFRGNDIFPETMPILFDYFGIKLNKVFKDFDYEFKPVD